MAASTSQLQDPNDSTTTVEPDISFSNLLELAANDDVNRFKRLIDRISSAINDMGVWYRKLGSSKRRLMEHQTPLMIAATYGSLEVVKLILSLSKSDVNSFCGSDKTTALHCVASSGSDNALDVIKILLNCGADPAVVDAYGRTPVDCVPPNLLDRKFALKNLIRKSDDAFMMYAFKIQPCSSVFPHDWSECLFMHPRENARRIQRDPCKVPYSFDLCPNFKKGECRSGDLCKFAHGAYERGLHPLKYKTRLCNVGTSCVRSLCFYAHRNEELRVPPPPSPHGSLAPYFSQPMMQWHGGNPQVPGPLSQNQHYHHHQSHLRILR